MKECVRNLNGSNVLVVQHFITNTISFYVLFQWLLIEQSQLTVLNTI